MGGLHSISDNVRMNSVEELRIASFHPEALAGIADPYVLENGGINGGTSSTNSLMVHENNGYFPPRIDPRRYPNLETVDESLLESCMEEFDDVFEILFYY